MRRCARKCRNISFEIQGGTRNGRLQNSSRMRTFCRSSIMTSRERIRRIIDGKPADRCGFWLGNPHDDTLPIYHKYFGTSTLDQLQLKVGDDFRWITPLFIESTYRHPEGKGIFD